MPKRGWSQKEIDELLQAIVALESKGEAYRFLRDLLTQKELEEFGNRWQVAQMLASKIPYIEIEKATGMSSTTIARIQKWLKSGMGGYRMMISRIGK